VPEIVAVQVLPDSVHLAQARSSGDGAEITELIVQDVEPETDSREVAMAMVRERGVENIGLAVMVNWENYSIRDLWLPFTNLSQLRSTIKFELEDDLEQDAAELLVPLQVLEQRVDSSHILSWSTTRQQMHEILDPWESRGISPEYMPPDAMGHLGLLQTWAPDLADKAVVTVSGDQKAVDLALVNKGIIWARRRVLDFAWATDAAGRPLQEIRRTFLSIPGFPPPEAVVSFGGEPADTLAGAVAGDLECTHRRISPPQINGSPRMLHWPQVAGVALQMARSSSRPLTFRIEEFEPRETAQAVSLLSVWAMALLAVCMAVAGVWLLMMTADEGGKLADVEQRAHSFWTDGKVGGEVPELENFETILKDKNKQLRLSADKNKENVDVTDRMGELARCMASVPADIELEFFKIDVNAASITLRGKAESADEATQLRTHLDSAPGFNCETVKIQPDLRDSNRAEFNFRITFVEKKK